MLHDRQAFLLVAFFSFVMSNGTRLVTSQIHRLHLCVRRLDLLPLSLSVCLYAVTLSSKLSPEPPRASSDELKGKLPRSSRVEPRANGRRASEAIKRRAEHRAVERRAERRSVVRRAEHRAVSRELPISTSVEPSGKLSRPSSIEPELARPSSSDLSGKLLRPSSADPSIKLLLPSSVEPSGGVHVESIVVVRDNVKLLLQPPFRRISAHEQTLARAHMSGSLCAKGLFHRPARNCQVTN